MSEENTNAKGPLLTRALGEDKVPIFFDVKEIKGAMEAGDTDNTLPENDTERLLELQSEKFDGNQQQSGGPMFDAEKVDRAVLPGIIRNNGQPLPGSWYLVDLETLKEIKRLIYNSHKQENFQDEDYFQLLKKLEVMVNKALES